MIIIIIAIIKINKKVFLTINLYERVNLRV